MFNISILLLIIVLYLFYRINQANNELKKELAELKGELLHEFKQTHKALRDLQQQEFIPKESEKAVPPYQEVIQPLTPEPKEHVLPETVIAPTLEPHIEEEIQTPELDEIETASETITKTSNEEIDEQVTSTDEKKMYEPIGGFSIPKAAFNKTNLEQFIGEKLISIIGIAILVLGIFFTVKWAVDKNMISDAVKILIGLAAGGLLIGVAHKLATTYRAFSSVLVGGAIAIFYFSIYQSFQAYHLLSQTTAFLVMIGITGLAVFLSTLYNRVELAMIALIGGFLTPFFVSTGSGNFVVLFSYMLILNIGLFLLANFKRWPIVYWSAYLLTLFIYGAWLLKEFNAIKHNTLTAFSFALLFHLSFLATALVYKLRKQEKFDVPEISLLLSNALAFLLAGLFLLNHIDAGKWQGLFVLGLAALYLSLSYWIHRKQGFDQNLLYLLIALVCTFISLAGPIQLDGNAISLFWAAEGVMLIYIGQKSNIAMLKQSSVIVLCLTLIRLILDWQETYYTTHIYSLSPLLNKGFLTASVVTLSTYIQGRLLLNESDTHWLWRLLPLVVWKQVLKIAFIILLFFSVFFELGYQSMIYSGNESFRHITQGTWLFIYFGIVLKRYLRQNIVLSIYTQISLLFVFLAYVFYQNNIDDLLASYLVHNIQGIYYHIHYALPVSGLVIGIFVLQYLMHVPDKKSKSFQLVSWGTFAFVVFILSMESIPIWVNVTYREGLFTEDLTNKAIKTAWPIIWSLCSLITIVLGMKLRIKVWRVISLSLFTLTIIKLFAYDMSNVGQGGKIAAFIILGIVLLVVSFLYQKIKGIFTDDQA